MRWPLRVSARDLLQESLSALLAHRLRALLSSLGVVVGVATVVTALAIGEGARSAALAEIGSLGVDNVFARAVVPARVEGAREASAPLLSLADVRVLSTALPPGTAVSAARVARVEATAANRHAEATLAGVTHAWQRIAEPELSAGRWFTIDDDASRRRVAILGDALARDLFAGGAPVGARVSAAGTMFFVIGVLHERSSGTARQTAESLDLDRTVLVPLGAMDVTLGAGDQPDRVQEISVRARAGDDVISLARQVGVLLERRHPGRPVFALVVPQELLRARLRTERTFAAILAGIGILALISSGVGIMNIMLANVLERTPEIGVRRAFGARRPDILAQFALESALLCAAGGVAGVPLGALMAGAAAWAGGWPISISLVSVLVAVALATAVGVGFGLYPAHVAAAIQPVDALRA